MAIFFWEEWGFATVVVIIVLIFMPLTWLFIYGKRPKKKDNTDTLDVDNDMNPTEESIFYITKWYPHMGAGNTLARIPGLSSPYKVMIKAASDMLQVEPSDAFPNRHKEHIAYALEMVASGGFLSSPAAVGSVYLATRLEFYFRVLSGRLKADGTWKTSKDQQEMRNLLTGVTGLERTRINSVALAYKIMKTNTDLPLAQICNDLDKMLYPKRIEKADGKIVSDIGDRIEYLRHHSAHGHWGDISGDAYFYGLMTVIVFYNQR